MGSEMCIRDRVCECCCPSLTNSACVVVFFVLVKQGVLFVTQLLQRGAGRSESSAKPLIHIVMSLKVLQAAIAQMAKDPTEQDFVSMLDANDVDGRCELLDGTPVSPKYALILMMQAMVRRKCSRRRTSRSKLLMKHDCSPTGCIDLRSNQPFGPSGQNAQPEGVFGAKRRKGR